MRAPCRSRCGAQLHRSVEGFHVSVSPDAVNIALLDQVVTTAGVDNERFTPQQVRGDSAAINPNR
eukprot:8425118-Prorocentrum_lima.AAC.1